MQPQHELLLKMICSPNEGSFSDTQGHIDKSHDDH